MQDQRPKVKRRGRGVEQSIKCSLPSGVAWRTRKSVPTPGSESLQRRATQPCVSISSFKASISFLTAKHTARSDDPVLLPTHRTVRPTRNLFFHLFPRGCLFYFPFLSSSILLPSLPLLFRFLLLLLYPPPSSPSSRYRRSRVIDIRGRRHCTQRCCSVIVVGRAPCAR